MSETTSYELAVFTRKARQAAHQSLYFLYLVRGRHAHEDASGQTSGQTAGQPSTGGALGDRLLKVFGWTLTREAVDAYRTFTLQQIRALVGVVQTPAAHDGEPIIAKWVALRARVSGDESLNSDGVDGLITSVEDLLTTSEPPGGIEGFNTTIRKVLIALLRNLALILALVAVWAVFFKVEAVHSLVGNRAQGPSDGGVLLMAQSWFPIAAALGSAILVWLAAPRKRAHLGKRAFGAFRCQALPPEPGIARWPPGPRVIQQAIFGRQLFNLGVLVTVLALMAVAMRRFGDPTTVTVFLVSSLCLVVLVLAHALDYWDFIDAVPLRFVTLATIVMLLGFASESSFYRFAVVAGMVLLSLRSFRNYLRSTPRARLALVAGVVFAATAAVVGLNLISATIGFFVAMTCVALWRVRVVLDNRNAINCCLAALSVLVAIFPVTSEIQERRSVWHENRSADVPHVARSEWPFPGDDPVVVMAASGGGSRAAIYTAYTLERLNVEMGEIADHLQAISSVSGGSLASAAYIARRYNNQTSFPEWVERLPKDVSPGELVRAVSGDFLLPTLWGALWPGTSRGDSIEQTWRDGPATLRNHAAGPPPKREEPDEDLYVSDLTLAWRDAAAAGRREPPFPLPLFNTCTLDQHDVVISPLVAELYTSYDGSTPGRLSKLSNLGDADWLTWVADRDAIYGLDKILPRYDPSLPKAVRASANFPFGFPLVALKATSERNVFSDPKIGARATMKLTDGGVLSNSGLWSLFPLLTDAGSVAELERRGVLLLIVEASKMPEYSADRRDLTTLYGDLGNRNPVAQSLHRRILEGLKTRLHGAIAAIQIDITPRAGRRSANVMTTWALDEASQTSLMESFRSTWQREKPRIERAWKCLRRQGPEKATCLQTSGDATTDLLALRPPLD
jgi:hypothetical protein